MASYVVELEQTTCWCGTPFALPAELLSAARKSAHTIYCPHGHTVVWKETEADKLRRERDRLKQDQARLEDEKRWAEERASMATVRAEKAERAKKRLEKRASAGTCPCCSRTFSNMATHMKRQHPEFVQEGGAKVVPFKTEQANAGSVR
jgi:ATPase subunit of ABC transporter with duplicated ATPase domains